MTVGEYLKSRLSTFGVEISEASLLSMLADKAVSESDEMDSSYIDLLNIAICEQIPFLILAPSSKSISENGFSVRVSYDKDGLLKLYAFLCKKYGLENVLDDTKPTIEFV